MTCDLSLFLLAMSFWREEPLGSIGWCCCRWHFAFDSSRLTVQPDDPNSTVLRSRGLLYNTAENLWSSVSSAQPRLFSSEGAFFRRRPPSGWNILIQPARPDPHASFRNNQYTQVCWSAWEALNLDQRLWYSELSCRKWDQWRMLPPMSNIVKAILGYLVLGESHSPTTRQVLCKFLSWN